MTAVAVPLRQAPAPFAAPPVAPSTVVPQPAVADWQPPPALDEGAADAGLEGYLQRRWLTLAATPMQPVPLVFPDVDGMVDLKVQATLFIDEDGVVRHIRLDTPGVHEAFAQAVREGFGGLRFSPGEVQGQPVRSQLRLEIEFQAGLPAAAPAGLNLVVSQPSTGG